MQAIVVRGFGFTGLHQEDLPPPVAADDGVVLTVRAAALNPLDAHYLRGTPYLMRLLFGLRAPRRIRTGVDVSGTVTAVGRNVTRFAIGDAVFGTADGSVAESVGTTESALAAKPANISFGEAAAVPIAGLTALQGLRDKAPVQPGKRVAIHGAAGGVGTFAVQIAHWLGAEVVGVCRTRNVELVRSLGADRVVDCTREDFLADAGPGRGRSSAGYDVLFDCVGDRPLSACRRALAPGGRYIMVGARMGRFIGPLGRVVGLLVLSRLVRRTTLTNFIARRRRPEDLATLGGLLADGKIRAVVDSQYPLSRTQEAMRHLDQGHPRGKVVITMDPAA
jgi:NADPH:quinone reductase-like Zn-dependent oxidoreductase